MSWTVRRAVLPDADAIARVNVAGWRTAYREFLDDAVLDQLAADEFADGYRAVLQAAEPTAVFLAVDARDELGAFCGVCPVRDPHRDVTDRDATAELAAIYADPARQGTGAGSAVHDAAIGHLATCGFRRVVLWVFEENLPARRFYAARGWTLDDGRRYHDARGRHVPQVRYSRPLVT